MLLSIQLVFLSLLLCVSAAAKRNCQHPAVRKEWRALSRRERLEWITAIKCLAHAPRDSNLKPTQFPFGIPPVDNQTMFYDDIVYLHMDLNRKIHFTGQFFTWHRWYLHMLENSMKEKCGYTGATPYWDWTKDTQDFYRATIFDRDLDVGLGTWGDPSDDFQVPDGAFGSQAPFPFKPGYPVRHTIRRNFTLQPWLDFPYPWLVKNPQLLANESFTKAGVDRAVTGFRGDFIGFQEFIGNFQGAHAAVHLIVGGDLTGTCPGNAPSTCISGDAWSPNDPLFFLHHGMVDKIWFDWQHKYPENFAAFEGGSIQALDNATIYNKYPTGAPPSLTVDSVIPGDSLFPEAKIQDVMDTTGNYLCYVYE